MVNNSTDPLRMLKGYYHSSLLSNHYNQPEPSSSFSYDFRLGHCKYVLDIFFFRDKRDELSSSAYLVSSSLLNAFPTTLQMKSSSSYLVTCFVSAFNASSNFEFFPRSKTVSLLVWWDLVAMLFFILQMTRLPFLFAKSYLPNFSSFFISNFLLLTLLFILSYCLFPWLNSFFFMFCINVSF